jgi:hypothetical protein
MGIEKQYISFKFGEVNQAAITPQEYVLMKTDFQQFFKLFKLTHSGKQVSHSFYWKFLWFKVLSALGLFFAAVVCGYLGYQSFKNIFVLLSLLAVVFVVIHPFSKTLSFAAMSAQLSPEVEEAAKKYYKFHYKNIHKTASYDAYLKQVENLVAG